MRKQMEQFGENYKPEQFNFKVDDFKIDPPQMEQFREGLEPMSFEVTPN